MSTTSTTATHHFEFFQGTSTESRTRPQITVRKGGLLVLTEAAARMLGSRTTHVQLAYDAENQAVGLRSALEDTPGSYRLPPTDVIKEGFRQTLSPGARTEARIELPKPAQGATSFTLVLGSHNQSSSLSGMLSAADEQFSPSLDAKSRWLTPPLRLAASRRLTDGSSKMPQSCRHEKAVCSSVSASAASVFIRPDRAAPRPP